MLTNAVMFTNTEKSYIIMGLQIQCCLVETGSPYLRAKDVKAGHKGTIIPLEIDQMRRVIEIEDTINKIINSPTKV